MKILTAASPSYISSVLIKNGYQGKIDKTNDYYFVQTSSEGWTVNIRFFGDTPQSSDEARGSIQLWSFWPIDQSDIGFVIEISNDINNTHRFVKTFVSAFDDKAYAEISADHYCPEGITEEVLLAYLHHFTEVRRDFYNKCKEHYQLKAASEENRQEPHSIENHH
jgi:hypothetical protein